MFTLQGRNALVCGATQGIGHACADAMARAGAAVTIVGRHAGGLESACAALPADHGQTHGTVQADFTSWEAVRDAVGAHVAGHGPVHILVNNTGGPPAGPAFEATPEDYARAFAQHLQCNQVLVQAVTAGMREERYGRIINIISTSVVTPIRGLGVSNTIRGAVANWARTLACELGPLGITVNNILPGFVGTARLGAIIQGRAQRAGSSTDEIENQMKRTIPAGRFAEPGEVGAVAAFLASPAAAYVNGVNLPVDGGRLAGQ
ncbi:MAG: SDR family oxidoreductase [Planctomycetes bacterium]|nr:SDR family oxidoreductase [Planctomycetota bacterium]